MKKVLLIALAVGLVSAFAPFGFAQVETGVEKKAVESVSSTATVAGIDYENRTGTLRLPDGTTTTFKAWPEAKNFDQLKVGDQVFFRNETLLREEKK